MDITILTEDWYGWDGDETVVDYDDLDDLDYDEREAYPAVSEELLTQEQDMQGWLARSEDEALILHRWNRAEDDLLLLDLIAEQNLQYANTEILEAYRRQQLHAVAIRYFGTTDYAQREVVTRWEKNEKGRWQPAEKLAFVDWLDSVVFEKGNRLAGYLSCLRSLQFKLARKRHPSLSNAKLEALVEHQRILSDATVEKVVARAIAGVAQDADDAYMEL